MQYYLIKAEHTIKIPIIFSKINHHKNLNGND